MLSVVEGWLFDVLCVEIIAVCMVDLGKFQIIKNGLTNDYRCIIL